jgi:hypothetical protein
MNAQQSVIMPTLISVIQEIADQYSLVFAKQLFLNLTAFALVA